MAVPKASLQSPLEGAVDQIKEHPNYLTSEQAKYLRNLIRSKFPDLFEEAANDKKDTLRGQLERMGLTIDRMIIAGTGADGGTTDIKRILDAQANYFRLFAKFNDTMDANERLQNIEQATIEALQEMPDKRVYDIFLRIFKEKLAEQIQK